MAEEKDMQHPIDRERVNHNRDADSRDHNYAEEEKPRGREGIREQERMDLASKLLRRPSARRAGVGAFHMHPREEEGDEDDYSSFEDHSLEDEVYHEGLYAHSTATLTPADDIQIPIATLGGNQNHPQINPSQASYPQAAFDTPPNPWESKERWAIMWISFMGIAAVITIVLTVMALRTSTDAWSDNDSNLIPTASPSMILDDCLLPNSEILRSTRYVQLKAVLQKELAQHDPTVFEEPCSPYDLALSWLADEDEMQLIPQAGIATHQRFGLALLSFGTNIHLMNFLPQLSNYQWLSDRSECDWLGVTCANQESHFDIITGIEVRDPAFGTVTAIEIRDLDLTGQIPNELGIFLPFLQTLDLANNGRLSGTIPTSLYSLQNLVHLNLARNRFSGIIDQEEWTTQKLEILALEKNRFVGKIPQSITSLKNLENINLSENKFTGSIPRAMYRIPRLQHLNLGGNYALIGTIPNLIRSSNLEVLDLSNNALRGKLPPALFFLSNLAYLKLEDNNFSGTLPVILRNLTKLEDLLLKGNRLSGNLPTEIAALTRLKVGDVGVNNMTGTIISALGNLTQLEILDLSDNFFTGPLPSEISNMISLRQLFLDKNNISDTVPTEFGRLVNLETLSLDVNFIEGEISQEVCKLRDEVLRFFTTDCSTGDVKCDEPACCSRCM